MSIRTKLLTASAAASAGLVAVVLLALYCTEQTREGIDTLVTQSTPLQVKSLELQREIEKLSANLLRLGLCNEQTETERLDSQVGKNRGEIERLRAEINRLRQSPLDFSQFKALHE